MKTIAYNPYLPSWEFVPDGEPHIFENRLYVYGSHDKAHGTKYCEEDYVGWSAPLEDLGNWKYEGVIYRKDQDPDSVRRKDLMFAPDAAKGPDGRYYLYYGTAAIDHIGVAVSDSPAGPFAYYGKVQYADGSLPKGLAFDPAILVEPQGIFLYYGISPKEKYPMMDEIMPGAYVIRLEQDMKTAISEPVLVANGYVSAGETSFSEHPFFEASSIRHFGDTYYFVYSSMQGHELCYATSQNPEGPFVFGGVIVSNGDVGLAPERRAYTANNHGGLVEINGSYYIFYHRHTHGTHFSRQACAERVEIRSDGSIPQVEITSCGLNQGALPAAHKHPAYIICNLHGPKPACHIPSKPPYDETVPFLVESEERILYLHNLQKGAAAGVKYLEFDGEDTITVACRGAAGTVQVYLDEEEGSPVGQIFVPASQTWKTCSAVLAGDVTGVHGVYFRFTPEAGAMDFLEFQFTKGV